jgi:Mn-containing catalase
MFVHNKRLQYTVLVTVLDPGLVGLLLEQFGGPRDELAAACRYFAQAVEDDAGRKHTLFDIGTEEGSPLEIIGPIVAMLNKGGKAQSVEAVELEAELYRSLTGDNDSHTTALMNGGGPALTNSAGVPWTAAYIDTIGEPTADLRSDIAAEVRAKIVYERLINLTDDPGIKEALGFLMTREIAQQKSIEKALSSIQPNFQQGKLPGAPSSPVSASTCRRGGHACTLERSGDWQFVKDPQPAVNGGHGLATMGVSDANREALQAMAACTA